MQLGFLAFSCIHLKTSALELGESTKREVVTACLEHTEQVVEQAREEMRANIEQVQQVVEQERAHLEREGAELRRQK